MGAVNDGKVGATRTERTWREHGRAPAAAWAAWWASIVLVIVRIAFPVVVRLPG
jgi:hypothetical protein